MFGRSEVVRTTPPICDSVEPCLEETIVTPYSEASPWMQLVARKLQQYEDAEAEEVTFCE